MSIRRRMREMENELSTAIKPYLKDYDFADTDDGVFALTGVYSEDISKFRPGDFEDGCTFVGHLIAKDMSATALDTLLVFEEDGRYIVGSTVGGRVIPIRLKGVV